MFQFLLPPMNMFQPYFRPSTCFGPTCGHQHVSVPTSAHQHVSALLSPIKMFRPYLRPPTCFSSYFRPSTGTTTKHHEEEYYRKSTHGQGYLSRYSDLLRSECFGDRIPVWVRFSAPAHTGPGSQATSCVLGTGGKAAEEWR